MPTAGDCVRTTGDEGCLRGGLDEGIGLAGDIRRLSYVCRLPSLITGTIEMSKSAFMHEASIEMEAHRWMVIYTSFALKFTGSAKKIRLISRIC